MHKFDSATFLYNLNRKPTLYERFARLRLGNEQKLRLASTALLVAAISFLAVVNFAKAEGSYPTPADVYLDLDQEHIAALERSARTEVTLESILAVDSSEYLCAYAQWCDLTQVEIVIFYDREHQTYGMMWSDPVAFTLSLAQAFANSEEDFLYTATWTLTVHGLIDHVEPLGSVMAAWVTPYLKEMGHSDPAGYLEENQVDLAQILAQEVLPLVRQDYFGDVLVAETNGTNKG